MQISLDYTNMMTEAVGSEFGIHDDDISGLFAQTKEIHRQLSARRERGELPFYDLPDSPEIVAEISTLAREVQENFDNLVVLGIGGSALGTTAIFNALCYGHNLLNAQQRDGSPRLFVLDNVDPDGFSTHLAFCDPARTCFIVISKSGTTVETTSQFLVARQWIEESVGDCYQDHFILITDPESGVLRELADREGYRSCAIPAGVGGRFSVFTAVGLLPLACVGVDIARLLKGAADFSRFVCHDDLETNPAYLNAALQYLAYQKGLKLSVLMPYSDRLKDIADWYRQLWAESLGKKFAVDGSVCHVGPTPVNALGTTDQHSQVQLYVEGPFDKVVTFIVVDEYDRDLQMPHYGAAPEMTYLAGHSMGELIHVEQQATSAALTRNQRSNCAIHLPEVSAESVGALIYMFEVQTLFAGYLFEVDPLDQPGVEEGKHFTYALMGRQGYDEKAAEYASIKAQAQPRVLSCE
ncbi:MAG: glucose-6-phosphate isomerase [Deltaproteobacteria bacterium]|nr:glucose-6-phosphate isomerase [Deltaproteobacteria bacterium]